MFSPFMEWGGGKGWRTRLAPESESCKLLVSATANHDFKDNERALLEAS